MLHMYIHVGSICLLTRVVVKAALTIAKTMVMTTSEKTMDSATFWRAEIRVFRRIKKGIVMTEERQR